MITYTYWLLEGIPPFRTPVSTSLGGYLLSPQHYSQQVRKGVILPQVDLELCPALTPADI
jgi:hypothetical protein